MCMWGPHYDKRTRPKAVFSWSGSGETKNKIRQILVYPLDAEAVVVMPCQALLEEWRSELARKPLAMSEKEACAVLGVPQEGGQSQTQEGTMSEDALKAAYRSVSCNAINSGSLSWLRL